VIEVPGAGVGLVASRDLVPGELILSDSPTILSPPTRCRPQCLQCCKTLNNLGFVCNRCGFPLCGPACQNGDLHRIECKVFEDANFEAEIEDLNVADDHYAAILPLRILALRQQPEKWAAFTSFLSHCQGRRKNAAQWDFIQEHSVEMTRDTCELGDEVSESELHRLIGIFMINSLEVELGNDHGEEMAFYPVFSNINHACLANARLVKLPDKSIEVRAKAWIREGEEVTIQYLTETLPTLTRRPMLARKWHFECNCKRCLDPAECGLNIGSLLCTSNQCSGILLPLQPLNPDSDFGCQRCGETLNVKEVSSITATAEEDLRKCGVGDVVENLERFLHIYSLRLHPRHQLMFTASLRLGWVYGRFGGDGLRGLSRPQIERKRQCCDQALATLAFLDEGGLGTNKWRDRMVAEIKVIDLLLRCKNE